MREKLISIILPVYNGEKFLKYAIDSILSQTYTLFELIIINDCSTDNSIAIINHYAKKDNRIIVLENKTNKKLPASLNMGHLIAKGKYITWTSDDNVLKPNFLSRLIFPLIEKKVDIVYSNYDIIDKNNVIKRHHNAGPTENLIFGNVVGASFLYRKEVFIKLKGYDENIFLLEDYDFWLRASLNFKFYHLKENLYSYRLHLNSLTSEIASNNLTNVKYTEASYKMFKKISDRLCWNDVTLNFIMDSFLNHKLNLNDFFKNKIIIEQDILRYSSINYSQDDMLYRIKLAVRNELVSKNINIRSLFTVLKNDHSLLFDVRFSKKTTLMYIFKSIFN